MNPVDSRDEEWLGERLAAAVPVPPPSADRMVRLRAVRQQVRRRRLAGVVLAACVAVGGLAVAVPAVLGSSADRGLAPPADQTATTTPTLAAPVLNCPPGRGGESDRGPSTLAPGATAARLCGGAMPGSATPPLDLLTTGLGALVSVVNTQPEGFEEACRGPIGDSYLLLLGYPDGSERRVSLSFSGCGSMNVGGKNRLNPDKPYEMFMDLLSEQRRTATPSAEVPAPACLPQYGGFSPLANPVDMLAARLCVSYNGDGRATSVTVPSVDLETILDAWRTGAKVPAEKGPGCGPTTPTWVLSGVTRWGDPVQMTAECNRPTNGSDWVDLAPQAQEVVDRLVALAGVQVNDGANATTAWSLVSAWLNNVNARAVVSYDRTAAEIARAANRMWVRDPWLPEGELDWDLLEASHTEESGWQQAWRIPARTPNGQAVFVVVRDSNDQPWQILSLTR